MAYDRGNFWNQQYHSDDSDVVRRGTQPFSLTGIQGVKLGNGDVFYLCSASAGGAITVNLPSATKNTGAVHFIKLRSTGDVIASAAGGTLQGSATMSTSGQFQAWRSNGVDWWPEIQPAASSAPVTASANGGITITYPNSDATYVTSSAGTTTVTFADPTTVLGQTNRVVVRAGQALLQTPAGVFAGLGGTASATLSAGGANRNVTFLSDGINWWAIAAFPT